MSVMDILRIIGGVVFVVGIVLFCVADRKAEKGNLQKLAIILIVVGFTLLLANMCREHGLPLL